MGRRLLKITWQETADRSQAKDTVKSAMLNEKLGLYALWQLRLGKSLKEVS